MKIWRVTDGVLRIEEESESCGDVLFGTIFGMILAVPGALLLIGVIMTMFGVAPLVNAGDGIIEHLGILLLSLLLTSIGGRSLRESLAPVRFIEVRHAPDSWKITILRAPLFFPNTRWKKTKSSKGVPNMTTIRRTGGMGSQSSIHYRVRVGGTAVSDFKTTRAAEALVDALQTLEKIHP